jgi:16S rRNA (cytosine967-C5)-methyltransferase
MKPFRIHHLLSILSQFDVSNLPLDVFLNKYFRQNSSIGSKDRQEICEKLYILIRWQRLIDYFIPDTTSWEKRLDIILDRSIETLRREPNIPNDIQVSFPKLFYNLLVDSLGEDRAFNFCLNSNESAPITIRTNSLKTARDHLFEKWKNEFLIEKCEHSPEGITFFRRTNLFQFPEFKEGFFEMQDEGSQLVAKQIKAVSGDHVLDFCAGSGGKTLAFAPAMEGKGQIYLYDIRPHALVEAKKRLKRAGIQNAQILDKEKLKKKGLLKRMNWILLDVPCSGSGTLRRNPDMKEKFKLEDLDRLIHEQRAIFETALKYLSDDGKIVYATCSVLPQENMNQVNYFLEKYNLQLENEPFSSFPQKNRMDGFFSAVLSYKQKPSFA